jgi:hypothetical protein
MSDFARDAAKASGHKSHCKGCNNAKSRRYYAADRARVIARVQARNKALREARGWRGRRERWTPPSLGIGGPDDEGA